MTHMRKFKAEAFDIMQYFYGAVHEPIIHCVIEFLEHIDEKKLIKAVTISTNINPLIRCSFDINNRNPFWKEKDFNGEDIVEIVEFSSKDEEEKAKLLASSIDILNGPQLKIYIIRWQNRDTLYVIMNHMLCDGAGFKEYLYLLSKLYSKGKENVDIPERELAPRSINQLFSSFNWSKKLGVLFSKSALSKQKNEVRYPLEGDEKNPIFITIEITKEELNQIKDYARFKGATVNDMIITAYIRALNKKTGDERIIIPCPVDLRKYLNNNKEHGICNLTSNFICDVKINEDSLFEDTLAQVSKQMKQQKLSDNCLKPTMILGVAFTLLPFNILRKVFSRVFTIPVTSFTNFGVINKEQLNFDNTEIASMYLSGAVKHVPYFQIAVSTYDSICTLSCNFYGTLNDKIDINDFLLEIKKELFVDLVQ